MAEAALRWARYHSSLLAVLVATSVFLVVAPVVAPAVVPAAALVEVMVALTVAVVVMLAVTSLVRAVALAEMSLAAMPAQAVTVKVRATARLRRRSLLVLAWR